MYCWEELILVALGILISLLKIHIPGEALIYLVSHTIALIRLGWDILVDSSVDYI